MIETAQAGLESVARLIPKISYKPGWSLRLGGPGNRFLCIFAQTPDSLSPARTRTTQHMFEVPPVLADPVRWVLDSLLMAERHEACEFYRVGDERPFWPNHQDEGSPYTIEDRRAT